MDSKTRTLIKALIWNAIGFLTMCLVGFLATGSFTTGGAMALVPYVAVLWGLRSGAVCCPNVGSHYHARPVDRVSCLTHP